MHRLRITIDRGRSGAGADETRLTKGRTNIPRDTLDFDSEVRVAELKKEYKKRKPSFTRFAKTLEKDITRLLRDEGIEAQHIKSRIKTFDSFYSKGE